MLKQDKGNRVAILNSAEDTESIRTIINSIHTFKELDSDPTIIREGKVQ